MQRQRLSPGPGHRHLVRRTTGRHPAGRIFRPEYLLANHLTPSAKFLYVGNRGHNSIAGFAIDAATGHLQTAGHASTEAVPSAFGLDPVGNYLFAAGTATGKLASYRIDAASGALTPLGAFAVGQRPAAVLATRPGRLGR